MAKKKESAPKSSRTSRAAAAAAKEPASIYTMMLLLAALFLFLGCIFLVRELQQYNFAIKVPADAQGAWQVPGICAPLDVTV